MYIIHFLLALHWKNAFVNVLVTFKLFFTSNPTNMSSLLISCVYSELIVDGWKEWHAGRHCVDGKRE